MGEMIVRSVEFRAVQEEGGDGHTLEGHAAVFNQPTRINNWEGDFNEQLAPGAFKKTLRERKPIIQFDHGMDVRTGSVPIASLSEAKECGQNCGPGLHVKARMFDNPVVEPIRQAIAGGAINGMSFRFQPVRDSWTDSKGKPIDDPDELESLLYGGRSQDAHRKPLNRTIHEVKLAEMGPVVNPAYAGTNVGVRTSDDVAPGDREALMAEYRRSMTRQAEETSETERSSGDNDGDVDDFDHFDTDMPVREDGLPDQAEDDERASKDPSKPYGKVKYADPGYQKDGKSRYPLDTKEHVQSALTYIGVASNAAKYSAADLKKVKAAIDAAAKEFGIEVSDDSDKKSEKKSGETTGAVRTDTPAEAASAAPEGTEASESTTDAARTGTSEPEATTREVARTPMNTKEEILARQAEIGVKLKELAESVRSDEALSEEKQTEYDGLKTERAANETKLRQIDERIQDLRSLAASGSTERGSDIGAPAFHRDRDIYNIAEIRSEAGGDEEKLRDLYVDYAQRAVEKAKFARTPVGYRGKAPGDVTTELLDNIDRPDVLAQRMLLTGTKEYERAWSKVLAAGTLDVLDIQERQIIHAAQDGIARAQSLGTGSAGGFAVPFQLDPTVILTNSGTQNPIRELARKVQITGKQWEGITSAGVTVTRGSEAATAPDSSFTIAQPTLSTNRVQAFVPFSYEIEMSWGALRSEITTLLVDGKDREEDSFITGDGTGTNPFGLLGYATNLVTTPTVGVGAFAAADVYNTAAALPVRWERNASWMGHKAIYNKLRQFDTAGGAELWARIGDGQPPRLLDYPDYRASAMSSAVATGNNILVLGDFTQFLILDRIGMNVELIPQIFDASNANRPTGQRGVYAIWMNNAKRLVDSAFQVLQVS